MALQVQAEMMLPRVEKELQRQIAQLDAPRTREFHRMLVYHMGWARGSGGSYGAGKRIRPLILLLVCASVGGRWQDAIPAAAALEIAHNFSLVHDDIQDNSPKRRGRPALWTKFGTPLAINAGDALFAMANHAILDLSAAFKAEVVVSAAQILEAACLDLTRGQFLDLYHQASSTPPLQSYWPMVQGKTAALLSAGTQIGAILGGASRSHVERYRLFGEQVGMAFQVQDDILGIWGNETLIGKSTASDLVEGKLSLPVLYGISRKGAFAKRWAASPIRPSEAPRIRRLLSQEGAYDFSVRRARALTKSAVEGLKALRPRGTAGEALVELTEQLLGRDY